MGFFKSKKKEKTVALFDIGSASVGGALVILGRSKEPTLVYQTRIPLPFQKELDFERFVEGTLTVLASVAECIVKEGIKHLNFTSYGNRSVDMIGVSFASPWYVSQIKTIEHTYDAPREITKELLAEILKDESEKFLQSKIAHYAEQSENNPDIIDRRIVDINLNGYSVPNPYGAKTEKLSVTLFLSVLSYRVRERVREVLERVFNATPQVHDSFGLIAFSTLRDLFPEVENFAWCDVTGEVTDIGFVRESVPVRIGSFPKGKNTLVRSVVQKLATTPAEARSLISRQQREGLESEVALRLEGALFEARRVWQKGFRSVIDSLAEVYVLPAQLFLMSDPESMTVYKDFLSSLHYTTHVGTEEKLAVHTLDSSFFKNKVTLRGKSECIDPFLAVLALFYNKVQNQLDD
jgi:cell division ATPase FtsA